MTSTSTTTIEGCWSPSGCAPGPAPDPQPCDPAWPGWETWDDFAPSCVYCVPASPEALPPPIEWEPCDPLSAMPSGCRQMKVDWPVAAGYTPFGYVAAADVRPDGTVAILVVRNSSVSSLDWGELIVADADGPVRSAMLQLGKTGCWFAVEELVSLQQGKYAFRILQGDTHAELKREVIVGGAAGELHPKAQWVWEESWGHPVAASDLAWASWDSFRVGVAKWGEAWHEVYSGLQDGLEQVRAKVWHDFVYWRSSTLGHNNATAWTPDTGVYPFIAFPWDSGRGVEGLGTDGAQMVWIYEEGKAPGEWTYPTRSIMVAPFTRDPALLAPVRLRSYPVPYPAIVQFTVGCGYAGISDDVNHVLLVRLSDGWSWELVPGPVPAAGPAGRWYWGSVYAITCEEVFVRGGVGMNIARVRLDALGPGTPPDSP
ncbi:MAG: hypothetical protein HY908_25570, partial [Myxococcales bacterium]|nr:hypothetical protein [Myxococcales bacterium]